MTNFVNAMNNIRHAEERRRRVSKHARCQCRVRGQAGEDAGGKAGRGGGVFLVAALAEDLVHGAERQPAARQGAVDRHDIERQDAMARRPLDPADLITERGEIGRTRHALWKIVPHRMRKTHLFTCYCRKNTGPRMS